MKIIMPTILIVFLLSCTKDYNTHHRHHFVNSTLHTINVNGYQNGVIVPSVSFELLPNQKKQVSDINLRGKSNIGVTYGRLNAFMDSFVVVFDGTYNIAHYRFNLVGSNPKKYLYPSLRNLYNDSSYVQNLSTNPGRAWDITYTFLEQDYLDAR